LGPEHQHCSQAATITDSAGRQHGDVWGGINNLREEGEQRDLSRVAARFRALSDQGVDPRLYRGNRALDGLYLLENNSASIVDSLYVRAGIRERKRD
jgi:hypothetical protein